MIHEKIQNAVTAINGMAGRVSEEAWQELKCVRAELADAAEMAGIMENHVPAGLLASFAEPQTEAAHG